MNTMKKNSAYFWLTLAGVYLLTACNQPTEAPEVSAKTLSEDTINLAYNAMQEYIDEGQLAGISVMVIQDDETVAYQHFGYADVENQQPITDSTIFRAFSMTKPITAVALMMLQEAGKFQLDDKVSEYIPEFASTQVYNPATKSLEPQKTEMTIRHLLTHTSGIPYGWDQEAYVDSLYRVSGASGWDGVLGDKVKILAGIPLKHQPGTTYEYGLSIDVAGYLVELLSGMPLDEYFRTKIFEPLDMDDTGFYVPEEKHSRFTLVYHPDESGNLKGPENPAEDNFKKPTTLFSGGGGLVTTVQDYARFARMLLNGGMLAGEKILDEATVKLIMSNQLPEGVIFEETGGYGLGGLYDTENGRYGWNGAASTFFRVDPKNDIIVLAFTQYMPFDITYANEFSEIIYRAIE